MGPKARGDEWSIKIFNSARKILPLLDLLAKNRLLALLANAHKDHSLPLKRSITASYSPLKKVGLLFQFAPIFRENFITTKK